MKIFYTVKCIKIQSQILFKFSWYVSSCKWLWKFNIHKVKPSSENFEITHEMLNEKRKIRDIFFSRITCQFEYIQLEKLI